MTITLKKALKAKKELEVLISGMSLPLTSRLSVFVQTTREAPLAAIQAEANELDGQIAVKLRASTVLANLRKAIGKANAENGIEDLLADQADIERQLAVWKQVAGADATPDEEVLKGELALTQKNLEKDAPVNRIGYPSQPEKSVTVSAVSEQLKETAEAAILTLRRRKDDIEDKRVGANASAHIQIADDDVAFLRDRGIV